MTTKPRSFVTSEIAYKGPVPFNFSSVPMETIEAYNQLKFLFLYSTNGYPRPLSLLCGPRLFGKTTIAHRLGEEIVGIPSVSFVYIRLSDDVVETEHSFWNAIGHLLDLDVNDESRLMTAIFCSNKRLCLFLDDFDVMYRNEGLTAKFIDMISRWQSAPYFYGFLGIGSYDTMFLYKRQKIIDYRTPPFNLTNHCMMKHLSDEQMTEFFDMIIPAYNIDPSTRRAIMAYSSGVPGVFASMIRCTIDCNILLCDVGGWHKRFMARNFSKYLSTYNPIYESIPQELQNMSQPDRDALIYLLKHYKVFEYQVRHYMDFEHLQIMGLVSRLCSGEVILCSEMIRRICLEAQSVRVIDSSIVWIDGDPIHLLSESLC